MKVHSMFRAKIKAVPGLYRVLYPVVQMVRRARYLLTRSGEQRFRDCCSALSAKLPEAYFINVGANDGVTGTPAIKILLGNPNWKSWESFRVKSPKIPIPPAQKSLVGQ